MSDFQEMRTNKRYREKEGNYLRSGSISERSEKARALLLMTSWPLASLRAKPVVLCGLDASAAHSLPPVSEPPPIPPLRSTSASFFPRFSRCNSCRPCPPTFRPHRQSARRRHAEGRLLRFSCDDDDEPAPWILKLFKSLAATNERSPKRLTICGFLPLPSITASPICTPTPSVSSQGQSEPALVHPPPETPKGSQLVTNTVSSRVLVPSSTPTWIATPPTPPPKPLRRSNTAAARRSPFPPPSSSASFPASMHPHATTTRSKTVKRSASVPTLSPSFSASADTFLTFMDAQLVQSPTTIFDSSVIIENTFDATFSVIHGDHGPDDNRAQKEHASVPIFRLTNKGRESEDGEDGDTLRSLRETSTPMEEASPTGSWSDHSVEDIWEAEKNKDAVRKFHALKELLATEVGYLMDLKALVTVYLRNLPTLVARPVATSSTFGRASASFTTGPWMHSYSQLQAAAASSSTLPETHDLAQSSSSTKEPSKANSRYIFSDNELDLLTRNAEEILQLHEHFVRELRSILEPLGHAMEQEEDDKKPLDLSKVDPAIRAVSTKFATEASRFNAYQSFCAGHPEAMDALRRAFQQYPLEMADFEQRCGVLVSDMLDPGLKPALSEPRPQSTRSSTDSPPPSQKLTVEDRKRAMSLTSLDGAVRSLRPRASVVLAKDSVTFPTEPPPPSSKRDSKPSRRIAFADYMIKPIQRICKYPLLLDQLLPSKALRTLSQNAPELRFDVDVVVESAAQVMRHVATDVDEARRQQDIAIQSSLIFSRMSLGSPATSSGGGSPSAQLLTPEFLSSLGNCVLSGSLDVMHYHPNQPLAQTTSIKAKYLGAFLYSGGYLILVKVSKGKKYEPRHWFSLADFEVSDVEGDSAMLPCSFRLSSGEQHFELAAACQREKDAWLSSMHESLTHLPSWTNEPTPSFKVDGKGELLPPAADDTLFSSDPPATGLGTIRSIPEFGNASDTEYSEPFFASLRSHGKSRKKRRAYETPLHFRQDLPPPPASRRSSSTSVKAIFAPMSSDAETLVIRRSSPIARNQVDQELQDVISQTCLTARSHAFSRELELFQVPKTTRSAFSRSNSSIGMARLSKHESVRVPRRRTTESFESLGSKGHPPLSHARVASRKNVKKLSLTSISLKDFDGSALSSAQEVVSSPNPSPPSSKSSSRVPTILFAEPNTPPVSTTPPPPPSATSETTPQKSRSFVRNVKGLFHFRPGSPVSPVSVIISQPSQQFIPIQSSAAPPASSEQQPPSQSVLSRWANHSLRRRTRSVPDEPDNNLLFDGLEKVSSIYPSRPGCDLSV
ncbi:unnamed protein product [Cyclocybe aegerita]|uniref:DH domain-containing protein n=1 Tax=Cyclocybe aegerita TaxID=1973307 RepID=A0A8S0W2R1_CYCAE|nr:unnamed protein product [Cyclocybe aegerita]